VPQFLLQNFGEGKRKHIWVFDKHGETTFRSHPRNLASERDFYEVETPSGKTSIDDILGRIETETAPILRKVIHERSTAGLTLEERVVIASFAAAQMLRTKASVERWADMNSKLCTALEQMGADLNKVEGFTPLHSIDEVRAETFSSLPSTAKELTPYFLDKAWLLYETTLRDPFYLGDNPITMNNTVNERPHRGNLGLGVPGIEIYLPLSSTLQLCFLCTTIEQAARTALPFANFSAPAARLSRLVKAIESGRPIMLEHESVIFQNSLQVSNASRYVYCWKNDFELALEMVTTHPENKHSPRVMMN